MVSGAFSRATIPLAAPLLTAALGVDAGHASTHLQGCSGSGAPVWHQGCAGGADNQAPPGRCQVSRPAGARAQTPCRIIDKPHDLIVYMKVTLITSLEYPHKGAPCTVSSFSAPSRWWQPRALCGCPAAPALQVSRTLVLPPLFRFSHSLFNSRRCFHLDDSLRFPMAPLTLYHLQVWRLPGRSLELSHGSAR